MRVGLRTRILLISSALLVGLTAATLLYVSLQAEGFVNQRVVQDLQRGQELIARTQVERLAKLRLAAALLASFPELRAILDQADAATLRDFLLDYQQRNDFAQLLIVFNPQGQVIARTDMPAAAPLPDVQARWLQPALSGGGATGVLVADTGVYHAAAVPAEAGGAVFGFLLAGARLESGYAQALRDVTRDEIVLLGPASVLGSTLRTEVLPWRTQQAWLDRVGVTRGPHAVSISGETYAALASNGTQNSNGNGAAASSPPADPVTIVSLQSRDQAMQPYRRIQIGLLLLGLLAAAAGVGGSALLARSITSPVATLAEGTRQVSAGNFDFALPVDRVDELGELAASFNQMTQGLRERADMQRFVSQSTVEMIQASAQRAGAGTERREMTVFFSDIRGFTAWAEQRPPEDVVRLLNRCLSLQATLVRKFSGDIDKFIGDAVFAHFLGPDMTLDAIRCAIEIHRAVAAQNAERPDEPPLELGIAIATGEAILGSIGSDDRLDYTAVGATVNLCSRLCGVAGGREILMNDTAYDRVRDLVAAEPTEPLSIKGLAAPVAAYRMRIGSTGSAPASTAT